MRIYTKHNIRLLIILFATCVVFQTSYAEEIYRDRASKPAPIDREELEKIEVELIPALDKCEIHEHAKIRNAFVKSFNSQGYNYRMTIDEIARNPIKAQEEGNWTGTILVVISDLSDEDIRKYYTEDEADSLIRFRTDFNDMVKKDEEQRQQTMEKSRNEMMQIREQMREKMKNN